MFIVFCYFPMWYPGSDVVLDCIVSWFFDVFLTCLEIFFLVGDEDEEDRKPILRQMQGIEIIDTSELRSETTIDSK